MKIGIVGTGPMNVVLAAYWAKNKHQICLGSRSAERANAAAADLHAEIRAGDYATAASFGDVVFFAVDPDIAVDTAAELREITAGKVVIDANNPYRRGAPSYPVAAAPSLAERIAVAAPSAHLVKAFNVIRADTLEFVLSKHRTKIGGQYFSVFLCGNEPAARNVVASLIEELRLDPVDCGDLGQAHHLEVLAGLSLYLFEHRFGSSFAINVVHSRESSPIDWMM
jgi:8-hydroxy-5-deazaflavin:NADPH oxidoreductase